MEQNTQRDRLIEFIESKNMSRRVFQDSIGVSISYVHNITGKIGGNILDRIAEVYPELNIEWLKTGNGNMINPRQKAVSAKTTPSDMLSNTTPADTMIPLLPISAQAGKLVDFSEGVDESSCELMVSPIRDAELAITVTGDSMSPEYPNGSRILLKKINESAFIDWGRTYVLDTCNGVVVKNVMPSETEGCIKCVSVNTAYPSFDVAMKDIFGMYRVLMCLSLK